MHRYIISRALILTIALFFITSTQVLSQESIGVEPKFVFVGDLEIFESQAAFNAECPNLALEDFEDTNIPPNDAETCGLTLNSLTNNNCYSTGALIPGFTIFTANSEMLATLTPNFLGVTNVAVGPELISDDLHISFTESVNAVGILIVGAEGASTVVVSVWGAGDVILGSALRDITPVNGTFFGVIAQEDIIRIQIREVVGDGGELLYNLSFGDCKQCRALVVKSATPADDTQFNFSVDGVFDFSLSDPSDKKETVSFDQGDTITVTEQLPPGWQLDDVVCNLEVGQIDISDVDDGISLECIAETSAATCTFFNSPAPRPIPTISEWGLISMAAIIGIIGLLALRRRNVDSA